jgi:hypothetical protein
MTEAAVHSLDSILAQSKVLQGLKRLRKKALFRVRSLKNIPQGLKNFSYYRRVGFFDSTFPGPQMRGTWGTQNSISKGEIL